MEKAIKESSVAVLLVSADFLASDFISTNELPPLLKSAEKKGTTIIPVIIKPCRFLREPSISQFQAINDPMNPLCKLFEHEQESIYEK
ncbi:MAG: toll/interleukin-1 receptor domain-containing protein [Bacteroidetes bacterium]|nr:toll/interleukin-1 receptor domain-containing protein [Bacteroidota bacterium]